MKTYILRRVLQAIPTLIVISFLIFSLLYLTPGDPVYLMLGAGESQSVSQEMYDQVREDLGLDDPFIVRYIDFISGAIRGDLGESYNSGQSVGEEVFKRMPATLVLTFAAVVIAILIAVPLGSAAAIKHNSFIDSIATFIATLGVSLPRFWFAIILIIVFSLNLGWFPSQGIGDMEDGLLNYLQHLFLPAFSLGLSLAATQTRMIRSSMLDVLNQDYVRFARSKGLKERAVLYIHVMKNSMIPVITVIGSAIGALLGGAVITESIFAWPGVGRLAVTAISRRDYPMIQGCTLILCTIFIVINLIVDIIYAWLNPRIRLG